MPIKSLELETIIDISDLKSGDHKVYEILFRNYYTPLCNYAYSILRNADDAEDIVQKTFCKLWDQREEIEIRTSVKSYLYRIVHNDCLNKIKQQNVHMEHNQQYAYGKDVMADSTESKVLMSELENRINNVIDTMPPRCGEVFKLSRWQQLSYSEIAQQLNISTNTVETQIVKALRILRNSLKDYLPLLILLLINN